MKTLPSSNFWFMTTTDGGVVDAEVAACATVTTPVIKSAVKPAATNCPLKCCFILQLPFAIFAVT